MRLLVSQINLHRSSKDVDPFFASSADPNRRVLLADRQYPVERHHLPVGEVCEQFDLDIGTAESRDRPLTGVYHRITVV